MPDGGAVLPEMLQSDSSDTFASKEELGYEPRSSEEKLTSPNANDPSLPPVDKGKDAWLFLAACFVVEALVWGKTLERYPVCDPAVLT